MYEYIDGGSQFHQLDSLTIYRFDCLHASNVTASLDIKTNQGSSHELRRLHLSHSNPDQADLYSSTLHLQR